MIITFNELRRIKDRLPSGSSQRIADELGLDVETVRNYFGGSHAAKECVGTGESSAVLRVVFSFTSPEVRSVACK